MLKSRATVFRINEMKRFKTREAIGRTNEFLEHVGRAIGEPPHKTSPNTQTLLQHEQRFSSESRVTEAGESIVFSFLERR